jgi:hypothetical protein
LAVATPDELRKQLDAVTEVRVARIERDRAGVKLRAAIIKAMDAGAAPKDIALAAGITRQRVHQIYREQ